MPEDPDCCPECGNEYLLREQLTNEAEISARRAVELGDALQANIDLRTLRDELAATLHNVNEVADGGAITPGFWGRAAARFVRQRNEARSQVAALRGLIGEYVLALNESGPEGCDLCGEMDEHDSECFAVVGGALLADTAAAGVAHGEALVRRAAACMRDEIRRALNAMDGVTLTPPSADDDEAGLQSVVRKVLGHG